MKITAEIFKKHTGHEPANDDLDRCNCERVGQTGHKDCGWDSKRNMPVFLPGESKSRDTDVANNIINTNRPHVSAEKVKREM